MADEAHIGFVDTHAESDRRHHDDSPVGNELVLMGVTCAAVETGMIGKCVETGLAQLPRQAVRFLTRPAIDDPGLAGMFGEELLHLPQSRASPIDPMRQ